MQLPRSWAGLLILAACASWLGAADPSSAPVRPSFPELTVKPVSATEDQGGSVSYPVLEEEKPPLSDLTLANFFTEGWNEESSKRRRASGTPDLALLRVQTNFMEREFRFNYFFQNDI